ncbi:hypothetical protein [Sporichthya polymorpha]|uniref:hypothetical protein n=1 Tax=Sporichthya polymorpha TaxID=35751 RepID=UPI0003714F6F|nr:hypothetical protein [Sporichthya polymorpha]
MRTRRTTSRRSVPRRSAVTLIAAALCVLPGCGDDDDPISRAQDAARNAGAQAQQKAVEAVAVAALAAIDPDLARDPGRALVQARAVCAAIENQTANQAAAEARKRFSTGSVKVDEATAKDIVRTLRKDLCPRL